MASRAIREIGLRHPESRDNCVVVLAQQLEKHADNGREFNGFLISDLIDLKATEAADAMQAAFRAGCVEEFIAGDWEDVQVELGLLAERLTPPPTFEEYLARLGVTLTDDPPKPKNKNRGGMKRKRRKK
jgi:hypothetical protein